MKKSNSIVKMLFIGMFFSFGFLFWGTIFIGQKTMLFSENRIALQVPDFEIKKFINSEFQNTLEDSISDQLLLGEQIKSKTTKLNNRVFTSITKIYRTNDYYYALSETHYGILNYEYMIRQPFKINIFEERKNAILNTAKIYNDVAQNCDKYMYFVVNDQSSDFRDFTVSEKTINQIDSIYYDFKFDYLKVKSFSDYMKYFYKNDHHWNYTGSYQAYKDIIEMMLGKEEEILRKDETITFDINFIGSKANRDKFYEFPEKFTVNKINIPKHKEYDINLKEIEYGNQDQYYNNSIEFLKDSTMHYALFYGGDEALIIFDFEQQKKDNLLIIGASDANAVAELIASHYNKTYFVDLRHYENFEIESFIEHNKITKLLYVANINTVVYDEFILK